MYQIKSSKQLLNLIEWQEIDVQTLCKMNVLFKDAKALFVLLLMYVINIDIDECISIYKCARLTMKISQFAVCV